MNLSKIVAILLTVTTVTVSAFSQSTNGDQLFHVLAARDELLFDRVFNKCETVLLNSLIADDFEFYHDQSGLTPSKKDFIRSISEGICSLDYKPRRELVDGSLKVFPLFQNGKLYAAIQSGEHRFYAREKDKPERITSTAKFTHLWRLEQNEWRLSRVLSYDHQTSVAK